MKKKFVWEKWRDPLLSNYDETEWPGYDMDEDGDTIPIHTAERQPVMHTPFGMLSVLDHVMASDSFDFWLMHTDFRITEGIAKLIDQTVDGVESLEVYTHYRARIGFPRSGLFQPRDVMHDIEVAVQNMDYVVQNQLLVGLDVETIDKVIEARDNVNKKYEHWAILVVPNGNLEILGTDKQDDETYLQKLDVLQKTQATVGGRLLTSESE